MDYSGIGVLLMGIALLVLAIYLARVLNKFANVIEGVDRTVEQLPEQLDNILSETNNLIHNSNDTLADVNEKLGTLTPYFQIVGDIGESTRTLSSSGLDLMKSTEKKMDKTDAETQNKRLGGLYGFVALGYYLVQKQKELKSGILKTPESMLYQTGKGKAFEIEQMKTEAELEIDK